MTYKINSCGVCDCLPEWKWHTAGFSDYDLWAVFRGTGEIQYGRDKKISVHDGICVLLDRETEYRAFHDPEQPLLVITVHFDFSDEKKSIPSSEVLCEKLMAYPLFFKEMLLRVVSYYNRNDERTACIYLEAALEEFFHADPVEFSQSLGVWHKIINEICTEIDTSPAMPKLSFFAEKYGYTERHISKMFTAVKKISYSDYTQTSRINKAKTRLRFTDLSIADIAVELGFCDACHFTKNFRKIVGITPLSYRKQI
ncbi:MAG: helix-turn-helix transcriptional regulator [Clostridia bacterium]|nr:helix-turn-helix transcriptional regulator [Clostridia bacterium]